MRSAASGPLMSSDRGIRALMIMSRWMRAVRKSMNITASDR